MTRAQTAERSRIGLARFRALCGWILWALFLLSAQPFLWAQAARAKPAWQQEVKRLAEAQDWKAAMTIVDREIAAAPGDMDIRAWRARVLLWSGELAQAESEYRAILGAEPNDPDNWMGLASVCSRQGRSAEAVDALERAVALEPRRADLRAALGRALRANNKSREAKLEFRQALALEPGSAEGRSGLESLRGEMKHELRYGVNTDWFSFVGANHDENASLTSRWNPHWMTAVAGSFYQRGGAEAEKVAASVTASVRGWGALTAGGARGRDNLIIPRSEWFFDYDRGWKTAKTGPVRGVEIIYGQHGYNYAAARILTLNESAILYFPREWTWMVGVTEARSHFSGTGAEWRPSGMSRVGFPMAGFKRRLAGSVFFAAGTEDFAQIDQIGRFASQTYGGSLRVRLTARQELSGYVAYQRRTRDRQETSIGISHAIRF